MFDSIAYATLIQTKQGFFETQVIVLLIRGLKWSHYWQNNTVSQEKSLYIANKGGSWNQMWMSHYHYYSIHGLHEAMKLSILTEDSKLTGE